MSIWWYIGCNATTYRIDSVWRCRPEYRFHLHDQEPHEHRSLVDRDNLMHSDSAQVGWLEYLCFRSRLLFDPICENGFDREWQWVLYLQSNISWRKRRASLHWLMWWMMNRKSSTCIHYQALSCYCETGPRILNTLNFVEACRYFDIFFVTTFKLF